MARNNKKNIFGYFLTDILIIIISIITAFLLVNNGIISKLFNSVKGFQIIGSFVAGMFFTSIFTTAPAISVLGEIIRVNSVVQTAFFGALGAVVGDLVIFNFVKDHLSVHLLELVKHKSIGKKFKALLRLKYFRWITFLLGGAIIASPLPDELGIGLMGFARLSFSWFVFISFTFNFIGILLIGFVVRLL